MDCKLVTSKLMQYLDEDLPATIYQQIAAHLDHCYLCAEQYHELGCVTQLAQQTLRCPVYHDGYERLRAQLSQPQIANILHFPRRLRLLRTALTGAAVTAAILLFVVSVGLPAIETFQAIGAVMDAQAAGRGPVTDPAQARSHSLIAWSSQIRWAESLAFRPEQTAQQPAEQEPHDQVPMTRALPGAAALPAASPNLTLPPFCASRVIVMG